MPTSPSKLPKNDWTKAVANGGTVVGIVVLVAVGLVLLVVGTIYLGSLVGLDLQDISSISAGQHTG